MSITSLNNFRDYGGYKINEQYFVKKEVLYRSDALCNLTTLEQKYLFEKLNIREIIDFRTPDEIFFEPDKLITGVNFHNFSPKAKIAEVASQETNSTQRKTTLIKIMDGEIDDLYTVDQQMYELMKSFVNSPVNRKVFSDMLEVHLNAPDVAILQHCRGGKDRTGFGCVVIMGALGVPKVKIYEEYLLSNEYKKQEIMRKMNAFKTVTHDQKLLEQLRCLLIVKEEWLDTAFQEIERIYGDFDNYLREGLLFDEQQQMKLKEKFTEHY